MQSRKLLLWLPTVGFLALFFHFFPLNESQTMNDPMYDWMRKGGIGWERV